MIAFTNIYFLSVFIIQDDLYPISDKEQRFRSFASRELDGQIYMTMQDFLESVTEENPRRKYHVKVSYSEHFESDVCIAVGRDGQRAFAQIPALK